MGNLDLFFQGEGLSEIQHLSVESDITVGAIKARLIENHEVPTGTLLFAEDMDEPLDDDAYAVDHASATGLKLHFNRCSKIEVLVTFNGETAHCHFAPSATVGRIKKWAAEFKFKMSDEEAGEHVLQISGTHDRPTPGIHIGALSPPDECKVKFDLVPDERINGATEVER